MSRTLRRSHSMTTDPEGDIIAGSTVSFDGTTIHWDLYPLAGSPTILILPGFWRTRRHLSITGLAQAMRNGGFQVATVDLRGHGDSGGTFGFNFQEYRDTIAVLDDIRSRTSPPSIALMGLSYGGAVAVTTAARSEHEIDALFLISPVASFRTIQPKINPLTFHRHVAPGQAFHKPRFEMRVFSSPRFEAIDDIASVRCPLAAVHVVDDWLVDHSHSQRLIEAHPGDHDLHLLDVPGGYHADRIFSAAPGEVERIALEFLTRKMSR